MADETDNKQTAERPPASGWRPKLKPIVRSGIETILKDPSLQVPDPDTDGPTKVGAFPAKDKPIAEKKSSAESTNIDDSKFGVPMDEEEARDFQRKFQAHGKWFVTDNGSIVGPDGVNYTGAPYDTPEFREAVEARSPELEFSHLKTSGRVMQTVVVDPGRLVLRFCTQSAKEVIWSAERNRTRTMSDWYETRVEDLGCCLRGVDGFLVTGDKDENVKGIAFEDPLVLMEGGIKLNADLLEKNVEIVKTRFSREIVKIMLPQLWWFVARVEAAMSPKNLGNSFRPI